jgi:hypothetical protein
MAGEFAKYLVYASLELQIRNPFFPLRPPGVAAERIKVRKVIALIRVADNPYF